MFVDSVGIRILVYSRPPQYRRPPNTAAHFQVPNAGFVIVRYIYYDSRYRGFRNTAAFSAVLRGLTVP